MQISKDVITAAADLGIAANSKLNENLQQQVEGVLFAPDSTSLHNLEKYLPAPRRFRGLFSTANIGSFVEYALEQGDFLPTVFIDTENSPLSARAIFNLGTNEYPQHAEHTSSLMLKDTPELAAVKKIVRAQLTQAELHDFIEDFQHMLVCKAQDEVLHVSAALAAVRNVTISAAASATHQEHDFGASRSAMDEVEAKSGTGRLPGFIECTFVPHLGLSEITARLRVSVITSSEKPRFQLRWVQQELQEQKIGEELQDILTVRLQDSAAGIFMGRFDR